MIEGAAESLRLRDREADFARAKVDDVLDAINGEIKRYLTRLDPENLTDEEHRWLKAVPAFSVNLEGAGDVVERNIAGFVGKISSAGPTSAPATSGKFRTFSRLSAATFARRRRSS